MDPTWNFDSHALPTLPLKVSQLHEAAYQRRPDIIHIILNSPDADRTALIHSRDPTFSNTALMWACMMGCLSSVQLLVNVGSNFFAQNGVGKTPVHLAVASGNCDLVSYLLSIGAPADVGDIDGATPVHYAAVSSPDMLRALRSGRVDFRVIDNDGDTPLHWACRESLLENVKALVEYQEELIIFPNSFGETPRDLAKNYDEREICEFFEGRSSSTKTLPSQTLFIQTKSPQQNYPFLLQQPTPSQKSGGLVGLWSLSPSEAAIFN
jgi:ankyrin repeat protein